MFETLQQQISELDNQKKQLLTTIQNEIVGVLDKYPEFIGIRWIQYIPSFNDREPIVETPDDAIKCFLNTNIDYLYFAELNLLLKK